jgi:hypothetical protein
LLNIFFKNKAINKSTSKEYFQKFFRYTLGNHRYDLSIVYHFLYMFYYYIVQDYKFHINYDEIMQLFDYLNEITKLKEEDILYHHKKDNKEEINDDNIIINRNASNLKILKEKIKSVIICMLIEILFSQEERPEALKDLFNYINTEQLSENIFSLIKDEIDKYFQIAFQNDEDSNLIKKNNKDLSKYYSNIFKLLTSLLYCLLSDKIEYDINGENNNSNKKETKKILNILSIMNILSSITNELEQNINQKTLRKETTFIVINFIKFLYKIIKDEHLNILYEHNLFFTISESIFNFCSKLSLINSDFLLTLEEDAAKTIIEIMFDIYMAKNCNFSLAPLW